VSKGRKANRAAPAAAGAARSTAPRPATAKPAAERTPWLLALAVFAFGILAYANTLHHEFVWDDPIWLEQKIRFYRGPLDAFFEPKGIPSLRVYRPLAQLTYFLDQSLWWRNPFGFHLTSVVLHAVNGALVLLLAFALGLGTGPALVAGALFLVHPVQPESVAWITNRPDVLATVFALITVLAALRPFSWLTALTVALASFGAAASKETGCVVPLLLVAGRLTLATAPRFDRDRTAPIDLRAIVPIDPRAILPIDWRTIAMSVVGMLGIFALRPADANTGIALGDLGLDALLRLVGSFGYQVERLLWPAGFWPYIATTPTDALTIAVAVLGALAVLALFFVPGVAAGERRFALLWILIGAALPIAVVLADFSSTPVAEHRLYLSLVGLALLVAWALARWPAILASRAGAAGVAVALAAATAVTVQRNGYWHDELTLWSAVVARVQTEPLPYLNLGLALADAQRQADAETAYRRALDLDPNDVTRQRTSINLGLILVGRGALDEAQQLFDRAIAIAPHAIAYRGLGMIARERAKLAAQAGDAATAGAQLTKAHDELQRALAINPRYYQAHSTLAGVFYDAGRYRDALAQYQQVIAIAGDTDAGRSAKVAVADLSAWLAAHPDSP
jgi:protein O-mannosyl-transferase